MTDKFNEQFEKLMAEVNRAIEAKKQRELLEQTKLDEKIMNEVKQALT